MSTDSETGLYRLETYWRELIHDDWQTVTLYTTEPVATYEQAYDFGLLHRDDGPAAEWEDGGYAYYKHGQPHREDGPASHFKLDPGPFQDQEGWEDFYFLNGQLHREGDLPAIIGPNREEYWVHGKMHRVGQPASTNSDTGETKWSEHGLLHRDSPGPAYRSPKGDQGWWYRGKLHREYGLPACIERSGSDLVLTWYRHGEELAQLIYCSEHGAGVLDGDYCEDQSSIEKALEAQGLSLPGDLPCGSDFSA